MRKSELTKDVSLARAHKQWRDLTPDLVLHLVLFLLCHTCLDHLFVILPMSICHRQFCAVGFTEDSRGVIEGGLRHEYNSMLSIRWFHTQLFPPLRIYHWLLLLWPPCYFPVRSSFPSPVLSTSWVTSFSFSQAAYENSKALSQFSEEWSRYVFYILFIPRKWQEDRGG